MRSSFFAQGYNLAVTVALQFLTTPMLMAAWGVGNVGAWMVAMSIAANAVLIEFGYTYAAKTGLVIAVTGGDYRRASNEFGAAAVVVGLGNLICILCAATLMIVAPHFVRSLMPVASTSADVLGALALLLLNALLQTHTLLLCAGQRALKGPAVEAAQSATIRLFEAAAMLAAACLSQHLTVAALAMCCARAAGNCVIYWSLEHSNFCKLGIPPDGLQAIRKMFASAAAYSIMPLAQALLIQFPVVIVGALLTPREVVQFVAMRTIARIGTTLGNVLNNVAGPEYSVGYGGGKLIELVLLLRRHLSVVCCLGIAVALAVWLLGERGVELLTRQHVQAVGLPFTLMLAAVLVEIVWTALFTAVAALNLHASLAMKVLAASLVSAAILYPMTIWFGLAGATAALLLGHLLALAAAVTSAWSIFARIHRSQLLRGKQSDRDGLDLSAG